MGQAEPAPLLQPLRGRRCALNQLSYKCQPSPYSRTRPPRGGMGECRAVPGPPMRSALGFGVLAAHLFCGFVVRFCSHLPRKAKNLRLPFSATGGSRLHVARLWRACLPLANYPMNTNICSLSKPVPPRGGMGETSPVSLGVMGECSGGLRGALRKSPWPHSVKKELRLAALRSKL